MTDVNFPQDFYLDDVGVWRLKKEKLAELEKPKPMTNEEYIHSLNTEQLADVFFEYRYSNATPQQQLWLSANEEFVKNGIVEWLKQPHQLTTK